ncbi:hypothetical protein ACFOLA_00825 [Salinicoccus hispanicus]|uniref:Uncharacterized protein n=1 Tax=Salinicoccus hispanicus TaxID=157225 RepID=A0A6N8TZL3_9STAP|nr:hypothetical protein [Salinicoccus hispanicus]MXQ50126.1 hypothetical protein [Salinicoccus hispanicus]
MWEYLWRPWSIFAGTWAIACDFLYHLSFMTWYIQFGPIILTFTLAVVTVLMDEKSKNTKIGASKKEDEKGDTEKPNLKITFFIPIYLIALVVSMTAIYGPPQNNLFDYTRMEFWIFIAVLTFSDVFKYWTDNKEDQKGGMRT